MIPGIRLTIVSVLATMLPETMARGIQFAGHPRNRNTAWPGQMRFHMICDANTAQHRLTKPNHPWSEEDQTAVRRTVVPTNGQVERMNRSIKERETGQKMIRGIISC